MDLDLKLMLEGIILDKKIGVINWRGPIELSEEDFIDLLNINDSCGFKLNEKLYGNTISYCHTAKYKGVEFLGQSDNRIFNL
jgi:hypothetical protein